MSKLKLVKLPGHPEAEDLEYWNKQFSEREPSQEELQQHNITIEEIDWGEEPDQSVLTLIKVGSETYKPSVADLEEWRQVFENAQGDPDFKIFTHDAVEIQRVEMSEEERMMIIVGAYSVVRPK